MVSKTKRKEPIEEDGYKVHILSKQVIIVKNLPKDIIKNEKYLTNSIPHLHPKYCDNYHTVFGFSNYLGTDIAIASLLLF